MAIDLPTAKELYPLAGAVKKEVGDESIALFKVLAGANKVDKQYRAAFKHAGVSYTCHEIQQSRKSGAELYKDNRRGPYRPIETHVVVVLNPEIQKAQNEFTDRLLNRGERLLPAYDLVYTASEAFDMAHNRGLEAYSPEDMKRLEKSLETTKRMYEEKGISLGDWEFDPNREFPGNVGFILDDDAHTADSIVGAYVWMLENNKFLKLNKVYTIIDWDKRGIGSFCRLKHYDEEVEPVVVIKERAPEDFKFHKNEMGLFVPGNIFYDRMDMIEASSNGWWSRIWQSIFGSEKDIQIPANLKRGCAGPISVMYINRADGTPSRAQEYALKVAGALSEFRKDTSVTSLNLRNGDKIIGMTSKEYRGRDCFVIGDFPEDQVDDVKSRISKRIEEISQEAKRPPNSITFINVPDLKAHPHIHKYDLEDPSL